MTSNMVGSDGTSSPTEQLPARGQVGPMGASRHSLDRSAHLGPVGRSVSFKQLLKQACSTMRAEVYAAERTDDFHYSAHGEVGH